MARLEPAAEHSESPDQLLEEAEGRMRKSLEAARRDLNTIRTGRAHPALVEQLRVDYYGQPTPLNQLATITVPEARMLIIQPWDRRTLANIERAILRSDLGLTPSNDGVVLRIVLPALSEERRRELVRQVRRRIEEGKVALRNIRRDTVEDLRGLERRKLLAEDEQRRAAERLQGLTDNAISSMEQVGREKEAEVMEV